MFKLAKYLIFDGGDINSTILLAGSGRSGTTWVENLINHDNTKRIIFEPFDNSQNKAIAHWNSRQYLDVGETRVEYVEPLQEILSGKFRSRWSDQFNRKIFSSSRLIKAIRANFLLPWIHSSYPGIPIVFLIRHPCAVAYSRMQLGWEASLSTYLTQEPLMQACLAPFASLIAGKHAEFEKHILVWCIENYVPLTLMNQNDMHVVFYEDLVQQKDEAIKALFEAVGQSAPDSEDLEMTKPSALSRTDSSINRGEDLLKSWTDKVTPQQLEKTLDFLTVFGLNSIYTESIYPQMSANSVLESFKAQ